jgi:RHS repeat-associated protein
LTFLPFSGHPTTYTTRAGQLRTSVFDSRDREIQTLWSDDTPDITRTFDAAGRVLNEDNGAVALTYTYNPANQILSETTQLSGQPARTVGYGYDAGGRLAATTYPDGNVVTQTYTPRGQIAGIALDGGSVASYEYNSVGATTAKTYENGLSALYRYDAAARLQAMRGTVPVTYSLNAVGQRTGRHDAAFGPESYAYDAIDQVIGANYGGVRSEGFAYDAMGNRQSASDTAAGITAYTVRADNTYATVGGVLAAHDGNGNMTDLGEGTKGEYDAQNRLVRAERNGTVTEFEYDGFNRCLQRRTTRAGGGAESLRLVYAGWDLIEERDGEGALTAQYVHGVQTDDIVAKSATSGTVYYHRDGLGSTVALSDATGQIVERYRYDVFGRVEIRSATGESLPVSLFGNRFLFTGREWLSEVGLYDYRNRFYSAELGRFLQTDPIRFSAGDGNLYRYVGNNAVNSVDPWGLCAGDATSGMDWFQGGLDAVGVFDPFGIADGLNAVLYLGRGQYGNALISAAGIIPYIGDVAKAGKYGVKAAKTEVTVIGRVKDLQNLGAGERSLLDRLPDLGSPKLNWKQNSGVLRQEMNRGLPIRDASVGDTSGQFLNAERYLLRDRGWTFDGNTSLWMPPTP